MVRKQALGILVSLGFMMLSFADQLVLPEAINVLEVNGKPFKTSFFSSKRKVKLTKGEQKILVQYVDYYDLDFDDHEKVKSKPFLLSFQHDKGDLSTDFIRPETLKAAKAFALKPSLNLVHQVNQKKVVVKAEVVKPVPPKLKVETVEKPDSTEETLEKLRYWWKKASYEDRQIFMREVLK